MINSDFINYISIKSLKKSFSGTAYLTFKIKRLKDMNFDDKVTM